jgi:hypothetical protein
MTDPIIEAAARNMCSRDFPAKWDFISKESREWYCDLARNCLAAATPLIRAAALEEYAVVLKEAELQIEYLHDKFERTGSGEAVLARIRALKEQP